MLEFYETIAVYSACKYSEAKVLSIRICMYLLVFYLPPVFEKRRDRDIVLGSVAVSSRLRGCFALYLGCY